MFNRTRIQQLPQEKKRINEKKITQEPFEEHIKVTFKEYSKVTGRWHTVLCKSTFQNESTVDLCSMKFTCSCTLIDRRVLLCLFCAYVVRQKRLYGTFPISDRREKCDMSQSELRTRSNDM